MITMQDALRRLTSYWVSHGCVISQPANTEVGAGTLNPATFLRVLGPEPWRVAYVEPSVRPDDSRFAENPNRIQTHTQFQVILKPEPGNPQSLYLASLAQLGIDVHRHDIRFVEDNWASPALGAWGLGWEVWLDGLEITQFTYFQQAGGLTLDPVSVEITYGIERILMALQRVQHFTEIEYAPGISYGEVFGQSEYEMSRYYLDEADIEMSQRLFEEYSAEARRLLAARLPIPAHSYVLKCSHAFNILDARKAIGTTERARSFSRMREMAHDVAKLWVKTRADLGHPLSRDVSSITPPAPEGDIVQTKLGAGRSTLAFEVGMEEIPPNEVARTMRTIEAGLCEGLAGTRLRHGKTSVFGTPRRVLVLIEDVAHEEESAERLVRGPRTSTAYDSQGKPTRAAVGFASSRGVSVDDLRSTEVAGVEYVAVVQLDRGRQAVEILAELLPNIVTGLRAEQNMRWSAPGLSFARPVRWLLALLGPQLVPFCVSSLVSGRTTHLLLSGAQPELAIDSADDLVAELEKHSIIADRDRRRHVILEQAEALSAEVGGEIDAVLESALLDEITDLVEAPMVILGSFERQYLELPSQVLMTVMRKHQRYLPVRNADGELLPHFITAANGNREASLVRDGNESVLRARFADAEFFWRSDLREKPESLREKLARLTVEERLGSMADRSRRIAEVANVLAGHAKDSGAASLDDDVLNRASYLAKFDLSSQMVTEIPSLAGVMAREYGRRFGESEAVAEALFEMELPRHAGDALPESLPGMILALADRFDLLTGLFAIGSRAGGKSDPLGLRRAGVGIVSILRSHPAAAGVSVTVGVEAAAACQPVEVARDVIEEVVDFIKRRYEQQLLDSGLDPVLVRAVLVQSDTPSRADATLGDLTALVPTARFSELASMMRRVAKIVPPDAAATYDPSLFTVEAEYALHSLVAALRQRLPDKPGLNVFVDAAADELPASVAQFFDEVLVMSDDRSTRENRLGLLATVRDLGAGIVDWTVLRQHPQEIDSAGDH